MYFLFKIYNFWPKLKIIKCSPGDVVDRGVVGRIRLQKSESLNFKLDHAAATLLNRHCELYVFGGALVNEKLQVLAALLNRHRELYVFGGELVIEKLQILVAFLNCH
jgi:urease accessory protein UreE